MRPKPRLAPRALLLPDAESIRASLSKGGILASEWWRAYAAFRPASPTLKPGSFLASLAASAPRIRRKKKEGAKLAPLTERDKRAIEVGLQFQSFFASACHAARRSIGTYGRRRFVPAGSGSDSAHALQEREDLIPGMRPVVSTWEDEEDAVQDAIVSRLEAMRDGTLPESAFFGSSYVWAKLEGQNIRSNRKREKDRLASRPSDAYRDDALADLRHDVGQAVSSMAKEARKVAQLALLEGDQAAALAYLASKGYGRTKAYERIASIRASLAARLADAKPKPEPNIPDPLLRHAERKEAATARAVDRFLSSSIVPRRKGGRTK